MDTGMPLGFPVLCWREEAVEMNEPFLLSSLRDGECAKVWGLNAEGSMRRRLLDIGLTQGTLVKCLLHSPFGDPAAYEIRGAVFALRQADSCQVLLNRLPGGAVWG